MPTNALSKSEVSGESVRRHFEAKSAEYERDYSGERLGGQDVIVRYHKFMSPMFAGKRILDVACGPGYLSNEAMSYGAHRVVGIDFSYAMLNLAHHRYPDLSFVLADAKCLPFKDGAFDLTFSFRSLQA
ncbi:class I SAM-dependent methyltransferase [Thermodesulfobacteriota bacterium]